MSCSVHQHGSGPAFGLALSSNETLSWDKGTRLRCEVDGDRRYVGIQRGFRRQEPRYNRATQILLVSARKKAMRYLTKVNIQPIEYKKECERELRLILRGRLRHTMSGKELTNKNTGIRVTETKL